MFRSERSLPLKLMPYIPQNAEEFLTKSEKLLEDLPRQAKCPDFGHSMVLDYQKISWPIGKLASAYLGPVLGYHDNDCRKTYIPTIVLTEVSNTIMDDPWVTRENLVYQLPDRVYPFSED